MIDFVYKIARQHHQVFAEVYNRYTLLVTAPLCQRVIASFRHPLTGGIKPKRRQLALQQRAELLRTNVNRVMHEIYCQNKESFDPLPSFNSRLDEQFRFIEQRVERHNSIADFLKED